MAKKKVVKKAKKIEDENEGGTSLDDAFGDDEGVEYAESKPRKEKKKKKKDEDEEGEDEDVELEEEVEEAEELMHGMDDKEESHHQVKASKPISKVKKGDKVAIDGKQYEVDSHYCLIDHGTTKEMAIEMFDAKTDKDYQLRYFDDRVENSMEFFELEEIVYNRKHAKKIEW